ncbi:MAG TPA: GIY-YIG nuclease family protein [Candidatus Dormibacteraeota bacterium]|nr:GIY-YIG nuclease family protein [Candidatus Dormibacteraeota bacterium]
MSQFFYVYILQSEIEPEHFYPGSTQDLPKRLRAHDSGRYSPLFQMEAMALENLHCVFRSVSRRTIRSIFEINVWPRIY